MLGRPTLRDVKSEELTGRVVRPKAARQIESDQQARDIVVHRIERAATVVDVDAAGRTGGEKQGEGDGDQSEHVALI